MHESAPLRNVEKAVSLFLCALLIFSSVPFPASAAAGIKTSKTVKSVSAVESPAFAGVLVTPSSQSSVQKSVTTFAQAFRLGDVPSNTSLSLRASDGKEAVFQVDAKAYHPDGSLRHALVSARFPKGVGTGATLEMYAQKTTVSTSNPPSFPALLSSGYGAKAEIVLDGTKYAASVAESFRRSGVRDTWMSGPVATEWSVAMPFINQS